jgi:hypothetical protein
MDDEDSKPVIPQRANSEDSSILEWLLGLIPERLLLALLFILIGVVPYLGLVVYVIVFVGVVAFIMYTFHLAYAAKPSGNELAESPADDPDAVQSPSSLTDD